MVLTITIFYPDDDQPSIAILSFAITIKLYVYHNYHNCQNTINVTLKRLVIVAEYSRYRTFTTKNYFPKLTQSYQMIK